MSILNFIQYQKAVNEASLLSTYYSNADKNTKNIAKKVDDLLKAVVTDKKKLEELTDLITDLNDAYAEERIDSQKMEERVINEAFKIAKLDDSVASLYAWAGIKTKYDDDIIKRRGQKVVDRAVEMAPRVLEYQKELKQMKKDIEASEEGKILIAMIGHAKGYGGSYNTSSFVGDLFN
jgi:hypothetical protein